MIPAGTLQFLKDLKKNNNKPWFDAHRKQYGAARLQFIEEVRLLIAEIAKFDPTIGTLIPGECIFRINRDVRFSKDKSPYKTNFGAYFNKAGKKGPGAGYYLHMEPGNAFVAGGMWMPLPADLARIRQEIDYSFDEWKKMMAAASFKKNFSKGVESDSILSRPPKGYDENNPAIGFIKMKSFVVTKPIPDSTLKSAGFVKEAGAIYKAMKPLVDFLNRAID